MEEVSVEELEALQAKVIEYENAVNKNHEDEQTLADLQQQVAELEAKKNEMGESRGK